MMNNINWENLRNESFKYPDGLFGVEERFRNRIIREKKRKKVILSSLTAVAASVIFILLINVSPAFANAVEKLPVIGELVEYVKFNKSLTKIIENEYVEEVNLVDYDGDNKLLLPYVIADEKNLILFFQMPEENEQQTNQWINISLKKMIDNDTGEKVEGYSYTSPGLSLETVEEKFGFIMQSYHFTEGNLPKTIDLEVEALIENTLGSEETMGTFNYHLELENFVEAKTYEINEKHTMFNQNILVEDIKVYPTGTEVSFSFPADNSALIKDVELEAIQDDNEILKSNQNGLSSSYTENSMIVFIESNYFDTPKKEELLIKGGRLLDKSEEFIIVDIDNKTITPNIEGIELKQVIRESENVTLTFSTQITKDDNFGMFNHEYKDMDENVYRIESEEINSYNSQMDTTIKVKYPKGGKVVLQRSLTPKTLLKEPIRIRLPIIN